MSDRIVLVLTIVLAAVYLYATTQLPAAAFGDPLGPKVFPCLIVLGFFIAATLLYMEISRAKGRTEEANSAATNETNWRHLPAIGGVVVWTSAYLMVFEALGYVLATAVYLFALFAYLNRGKWLTNVLTVVCFSVGSYLLFTTGLKVQLPKGIFRF